MDTDRGFRLLRAAFIAGAVTDALAVIPMLSPSVAAALWGFKDPGGPYLLAMGSAAALMLGWTGLLVWAWQRPLERRFIAALTAVVIGGLAVTEIVGVLAAWVALWRVVPTLILQTVLLALFGVAEGVITWRFVAGLGAVSNMNDGYAWGIWEPVNVVVFTGIGAGALGVGLLTYLVNRGEYHGLVRPAVLLGAICYTLGGSSIMVALGRYWNALLLPFPPLWNLKSALLEVAVCVLAYICVLWIEVLPSVLDGAAASRSPRWSRIGKVWGPRLASVMPYVIALAIVLPVMHQSSLGGLMLLERFGLFPNAIGFFWGALFLAAAAYFLYRFAKNPLVDWWAAIPGGVLVTIAVMIGLSGIFPGLEQGGVMFLGIGLTFLVLYLIPTANGGQKWAVFPAIPLIVLGLLFLLTFTSLWSYFWPLALVIAGGWMLWRAFRPGSKNTTVTRL